MHRRQFFVLLVLPFLALASGCSEAASFNNEMSQLTKELEQAARKFGEQLVFHQGNKEKLQEDQAAVVAEVGRIVKRAKAIKVPKLKGAQEYHEAFLDFIESDEKLVDQECAALLKLSARRDSEALFDAIQGLMDREQKQLDRIKAAQKVFAKTNNLTIPE